MSRPNPNGAERPMRAPLDMCGAWAGEWVRGLWKKSLNPTREEEPDLITESGNRTIRPSLLKSTQQAPAAHTSIRFIGVARDGTKSELGQGTLGREWPARKCQRWEGKCLVREGEIRRNMSKLEEDRPGEGRHPCPPGPHRGAEKYQIRTPALSDPRRQARHRVTSEHQTHTFHFWAKSEIRARVRVGRSARSLLSRDPEARRVHGQVCSVCHPFFPWLACLSRSKTPTNNHH
jgi:hypothetical protein